MLLSLLLLPVFDIPPLPGADTTQARWLADLDPATVRSGTVGTFVFVPGSAVDEIDGHFEIEAAGCAPGLLRTVSFAAGETDEGLDVAQPIVVEGEQVVIRHPARGEFRAVGFLALFGLALLGSRDRSCPRGPVVGHADGLALPPRAVACCPALSPRRSTARCGRVLQYPSLLAWPSTRTTCPARGAAGSPVREAAAGGRDRDDLPDAAKPGVQREQERGGAAVRAARGRGSLSNIWFWSPDGGLVPNSSACQSSPAGPVVRGARSVALSGYIARIHPASANRLRHHGLARPKDGTFSVDTGLTIAPR